MAVPQWDSFHCAQREASWPRLRPALPPVATVYMLREGCRMLGALHVSPMRRYEPDWRVDSRD